MSDYEFIKQFTDISVRNICYDLHLEKDYRNIISGRARPSKLKKVRIEIEKRLDRIGKYKEY